MTNVNQDKKLPEVDFRGLILGFSGAAYQQLSAAAKVKKDTVGLAVARQNIEIIELLSEKTKGNLTPDEESLVQQVLLDLRMKFIECSNTCNPKSS